MIGWEGDVFSGGAAFGGKTVSAFRKALDDMAALTEAGEMNLEGEPKVSAFFFFALVVLLLGAMVVAFLCQGCAIGSDYVRTDSTVTYIGAPPPVGFGPRSL